MRAKKEYIEAMDELNLLLARKRQLEKQILKGRLDLYSQYNQVWLHILKVQYPIHFKWAKDDEPKK
jgi:hypothetical protein